MKAVREVEIIKVNNGAFEIISDPLIVEARLNINVNRKFYASLMCTPDETMQLAVGFLFSEGIISSLKSIKSIEERADNSLCIILKYELEPSLEQKRTLTSGCAGGSIALKAIENSDIKPIESSCKYSINNILTLMNEFNHKSELFKETGGVHSCSLCSKDELIYFSEDIGRHNALDKVIGKALFNEMRLDDKLLVTTGRISSDITLKAAKAGIPVVVSHSAPTDMALSIAKASNITMIGFARGNRMNIYCGEERIYKTQ